MKCILFMICIKYVKTYIQISTNLKANINVRLNNLGWNLVQVGRVVPFPRLTHLGIHL